MIRIESDAHLLERFARHRDSDAFAEIVSRYTDPIYATTRRILRDSDLAHEATQETFIRLLNHASMVSRSLGGWLHRTATLIAIDMVRRDARRRRREADYALENPREISNWEELSPVIDLALNDLPEGERALVVDHFLLGKSQLELAEEHATSPATMSRRVRQALESLRGALKQRGVLVVAAALSAWLASQAAEAAPVTLTRELGKMKLFQYARPGARDMATRMALRRLTLIGAGSLAVMFALTMMAAFWPDNSSWKPLPGQGTPPPEAACPTSKPLLWINLPGPVANADDFQTIAAFQLPSNGDGQSILVAFRDSHEVKMPLTMARRLVEGQTHQTFEEVIQGASPTKTPAGQ